MTDPYIRTFTGKQFKVFSPDPEMICIEDIAHSLSNTCRYTGHSSRFYSVAEHSILVSMILPDELKLAGLLHDASEAYLADLPTPLKRNAMFANYRAIEDKLQTAIYQKFGVYQGIDGFVKYADSILLGVEVACLLNGSDSEPDWSDRIIMARLNKDYDFLVHMVNSGQASFNGGIESGFIRLFNLYQEKVAA